MWEFVSRIITISTKLGVFWRHYFPKIGNSIPSLVRGLSVVRGFERQNFSSHPLSLKIASKITPYFCVESSSKCFKIVLSTTNCLNLLIKVVDGNYEQKVSFKKRYWSVRDNLLWRGPFVLRDFLAENFHPKNRVLEREYFT